MTHAIPMSYKKWRGESKKLRNTTGERVTFKRITAYSCANFQGCAAVQQHLRNVNFKKVTKMILYVLYISKYLNK